jgi:signal transduction histidine kinase
MTTRLRSWLLIALSLAGMLGLSTWMFARARYATSQLELRWMHRVSSMVLVERQSFRRWIEQLPAHVDAEAIVSRSPYEIGALYLIDNTHHRTGRWINPLWQETLSKPDPRLVALQIQSIESGKVLEGPVLLVSNIPFVTMVKPIGDRRALVAVVKAPDLRRMLEEEARAWGMNAFIYDEELRPVLAMSTPLLSQARIKGILDDAVSGRVEGHVPLDLRFKLRSLATYLYDPQIRWLYVVIEPLPFVWGVLGAFLLGLTGILLLSSIPWRSIDVIRKMRVSRDLATFSARIDKYVHGRDVVLPDPPVPYGHELNPILQSLRWLMPQWKKAELYPKELGLERKLLSLLVESLPEGILFFNAQGGLQLSNELGRSFLGLQQEPGREFKMISGVTVPRGFLEPFTEPVFTGQTKTSGKEVEVKWPEGKHLHRIWVEAVETDKNKVEGFMVVIRDITFRKQWEHVQEQVLSGITHDLRGPLSAVMGYLDLIRRQLDKVGPPKALEYAKLARDAAVRLNQMVSDILDVVRFEQGKIELQPEAIPVNQIFERLKNIYTVQAEQKGVVLKLMSACPSDTTAWGDPKLLERVFDNLVGNAVKFTPSGGSITVTARIAGGRNLFEVIDTGRGIPKEAQSRIFDKFQQVRPGDRSGGYGLGLAVVKFIVEAHKGEIRVDSEVGVGSRFSFWFPDQVTSQAAP